MIVGPKLHYSDRMTAAQSNHSGIPLSLLTLCLVFIVKTFGFWMSTK